jgi:hypothetical protein
MSAEQSVEQKVEHRRAKLIPVEGRPGIYTYEDCELIIDPLTVIRGIILREQTLMSQGGKSST